MTDAPSPGWYPSPDADDAQRQRYWDGTTWTDQYRIAAQCEGPPSRITEPVAIVVGVLGLFFLFVALRNLLTKHYTNGAYEAGQVIGGLGIPAVCLYIAWRGLRHRLLGPTRKQ